MAKKTQVIQLQTEVNNDEDWEKLLQRDGLIVVDIYSEWCGPCSGMTATLKKLKLEIGGDLLQLAIAKSDKIAALERFRNKSEPTWMFIVNSKMTNFMFGANAPKLTKLITDELKKEQDARAGKRERVQTEIEELADEERERREVVENQLRAAKEKEVAKAAKDLYDRRMAECNNILENLNHFGVILIFPHARTMYHDAFGDLMGEAGLTISQAEKIVIQEQQLDELFYFSQNPFPEDAIEELLSEEISHVLLIKPIPARDVTEPTDELLQEIVYGKMKKPPGEANSPAKILERIEEQVEEEGPPVVTERVGVWVPMNSEEKATALKLFFQRQTEHYLIPEPEPEPPHYAVVFEAFRRHELAEIMEKYQEDILRLGFFTSEKPEEAKLVAKTIKQYEKNRALTGEEKLVLELSKKRSESVLAFVSMKPSYVSPNAMEGKRECDIFFPDDYDEPPPVEEEEEEVEEKDPKKKIKEKKAEGEEAESEEGAGVEEPVSRGSSFAASQRGSQTPAPTITPAAEGGAPEGETAPEGEAAPEGEPAPEKAPEGEAAPAPEGTPEPETAAAPEEAPVESPPPEAPTEEPKPEEELPPE